ncbi:MAG: DUF3526 domain-containing protein [Bacteroidota bacterium]
MRINILMLIARHFWISIFKTKTVYLIIAIIGMLLVYSVYSGMKYYEQNHFRNDHQKMARQSWEGNPDKHPHRMAHFGTFAFRTKHPLSQFDFGIESFTGNAIFLEAHKQNTANFSEAGFSTGLLRFGELSMALILQTILPLVIFFIGYSAIVGDREYGTLKLLLTQGAKWKEILFGRSIGLTWIASLFSLPFIIVTLFLLLSDHDVSGDVWARFALITTAYLLFAFILSLITIFISTTSGSSRNALVKLLGLWLFMTVLLPRSSQALGTWFYPSPTKLEFRSLIEAEVIQNGDSHNPNDPHYQALRDSVLLVHQVSDVTELPFNYGGFVMSKGEELSARIYNKHQKQLLAQYRKQNQLNRWLAIINPYLTIKSLSMALSGTDFKSYVDFQQQAEQYRYQLSQKMNELQIKYISPDRVSGSEGKSHVVDKEEWKAFPDFEHTYLSIGTTLKNEILSSVSMLLWIILSIGMINILSKKAKAV